MWDADDRAALIDPDMPGYALATKADLSTVDGLFRQAYADVFNAVGGRNPTFLCAEADAPAKKATITISGTLYRIIGRQPDGQGFTLLDLEVV